MVGRKWIDAVSRLLVTSPELSPIFLGVLQITGIALGILALKRWHGQDKSWVRVNKWGNTPARQRVALS